MNDGFYLSVYICIDKIGHIKKFETRHDFNISLWNKRGQRVELVHLWELERVSGIKQHGRSFFSVEQAIECINNLLAKYNLSLSDMESVWGFPEYVVNSSTKLKELYPEIYFHSICHLFSSLLLSMNKFRNEKILAFALDGSPDYLEYDRKSQYYFAAAYSENGRIKQVYPAVSPAELWTDAKLYFKMREGTLMALAYASKSKAYLDFEDDGVLKFRDMGRTYTNVKQMFDTIMNFKDEDEGIRFNYYDPRFSIEDNKISMAIKLIQEASIKIMERNIDEAIKKFHIDPHKTILALSGGFALNCPTNSYIMKKYGFKEFIAPPCINDGGISLGIGLLNFYNNMSQKFDFEFKDAFYGDSDYDIGKSLSEFSDYISTVEPLDYVRVARDIEKEPIVWFYGRAEVGPRALGHRSILANPEKSESKIKINLIKQREWWRPVAPIMLEEHMVDWFENGYASPYMLHNFAVKEEKKDRINAVLHLDETARVQTLNKTMDPIMYEIINAFYNITNIPMICNTSLNDKGEPIINTVAEAFNFALRKNINILYVNGVRIVLKKHYMYKEELPAHRGYDIEFLSTQEEKECMLQENPHELSDDILHYYVTTNKKYECNINIKEIKETNILKKLYKYHQRIIS